MNNQMAAVLVTRASSGIGKAVSEELVRRGYRVFAGVRKLGKAPDGSTALLLDVTKAEHLRQVAEQLEGEELARVVNNAGINYLSPFEDADEEQARRLMEVNFWGLCRMSQAVVPHLRRYAAERPGKTAKLIQVSSIGGLVGIPWEVYYHASKFAVMGLTGGLRSELWAQGIRAVAVCPRGVRTPFLPKTREGLREGIAALPESAQKRYGADLRKFLGIVDVADQYVTSAGEVARRIRQVLEQKNPAERQLVGADARLLFGLSQGMFGWMMRRLFTAG
jgi:NAD(P)-dependent dehydrogenase (short-subunit alcohol dehydrogenase family)